MRPALSQRQEIKNVCVLTQADYDGASVFLRANHCARSSMPSTQFNAFLVNLSTSTLSNLGAEADSPHVRLDEASVRWICAIEFLSRNGQVGTMDMKIDYDLRIVERFRPSRHRGASRRTWRNSYGAHAILRKGCTQLTRMGRVEWFRSCEIDPEWPNGYAPA